MRKVLEQYENEMVMIKGKYIRKINNTLNISGIIF